MGGIRPFGQSPFGTFPRQAVTPSGLVPIDPPPGPDPSVLKQCSFSADKKWVSGDASWNNPNRYAACRGAEENIYRHSKLATYSILPADSLDHLDDSVPPANLGGGEKLRHFKWGPVGNALVYVDLNKNIRYRFSVWINPVEKFERFLFKGRSRGGRCCSDKNWRRVRVSRNFRLGLIDLEPLNINSQFKVYEEEVLGSIVPLWWSPDGTKIAFASFDDTSVDQVALTR